LSCLGWKWRKRSSVKVTEQRKHYTPEEKVAILRRHLVEGVPISDLSNWGSATVFYRWQKEFFAALLGERPRP
jgi:transposase